MTLRMSRLGRSAAILLLGVMAVMCAGCFSPGGPPLPEGMLREGGEMPAVKSPSADEYVLQPGDEVEVQVYREPELSGSFQLKSSGQIRHPLIGSVGLAGKTVKKAEAYFTKRLADGYLVRPRVIIKLVSTQSSQIVLLGEVKEPGVYPLPVGEQMTLLQAIAGAGGFTELASPDRVRIVRKGKDGKQTTLRVRVSNLLGGGRQKDIPLKPNDVIMVPEVVF
jgi:protein involved in polysaccharide export with SLBB domain